MPAKLCNGVATDHAYLRSTKSYCEGLRAATSGALIGTNPHPAGDDHDAWDRGFADYNGGVGAASQVCCCDPVYDGV